MSRGPASTTEGPSKTARKRARALVNQADRLLGDVLDPTGWQPDSRRVAAFLSSEDFERFLGLYLRAMDLDGLEPAYPWNLGSALNRLGRPDLALGFVGRAVKTGEASGDDEWAGPDCYLLWAQTAINAGQDDVAFVAIAKAVAQAHDDEETADAAVALLRALGSQSSGTALRRTKSTEDLMARLIERAFPTARQARKEPGRAREPV